MLEAEIRHRKADKDILLMTHIVLGYPSFDDSLRIVEQMVEAGVDLMELQIPFSEPIADGPVILHANQKALAAGATVDRCLELAGRLTREFPIPFLFMSYYNIAWKRGLPRFASETRSAGLHGAIIPDLPFEEGEALLSAFERESLAPVFIFSPNTSDARMRAIAQRARGFVYCVARKGVTGEATNFAELGDYLARCRQATDLPLALGFGVKSRADVAAISGKAAIAVVGSETVRVVDRAGVNAVGAFLRGLR
ncbi:MAG TPA: tryptophan synthase subunit alpha [Polyangiales bacterium]